jgi:alpha-beta hydrolase superfamily lysophospholipase
MKLAILPLIALGLPAGVSSQSKGTDDMTDMPYRDVEANGLRMRIADRGTGPVVLLCHGFPETAYAWRHQIEALSAQGYRVIAPDLRGFGGTDATETVEAYALQMLVGDMVALLDVRVWRRLSSWATTGAPLWRGRPPFCALTASKPLPQSACP